MRWQGRELELCLSSGGLPRMCVCETPEVSTTAAVSDSRGCVNPLQVRRMRAGDGMMTLAISNIVEGEACAPYHGVSLLGRFSDG